MESERAQWEQRYLEEIAMRQVALDAVSIPKDTRIAALEKCSAESEKIIAEARSDKLKQFEEVQNSQVSIYPLAEIRKTGRSFLFECAFSLCPLEKRARFFSLVVLFCSFLFSARTFICIHSSFGASFLFYSKQILNT